mgnify:CR=1 FL=1
MEVTNVEQVGRIFSAIITEEFEPVIAREITRIVRYAKDEAKARIEREVRELAFSLESQVTRLADKLKTQVRIEFKLTVPDEWEDKRGD